ncbi:MAG TPA: RagB/SusD family nutrient uptake outer membrane protein [Chitinophagaceae bacterium]|nr:RagB/SusD family nutrient uptake outer membrane protein [Chitinophagaceae bacterium]
MKIIFKLCILITISITSFSCKKDLLDTESTTILSDDQIWNDPKLVTAVLANMYNRLPRYASTISTTENYAIFDDAMWSGLTNQDLEIRNNLPDYAYDRWRYWDYTLIRDIHVALDQISAANSPTMTTAVKAQFDAEFRFLRAMVYFELVKRMGGVPLVTSQLIYDFKGDVSPLRKARSKEEEVYDFIASEADAIKDAIGNAGNVRRANKYAVLALKSRAMLYAGSLAKYNNTPGFTRVATAGGEVGIPAAKAQGYYQKSLAASNEIINSGVHELYKGNLNLGENFWEALTKKAGNKEVILVHDYNKAQGRRHTFPLLNTSPSLREEATTSQSETAPSLNLVESFEYTDAPVGTLKGVGTGSNTAAGQAAWIFYDKLEDIFAKKDARLYGTVMYPGSSFANKPLQILAGTYTWNATTNKYDRQESGPGTGVTGIDGPSRNQQNVSNTGFYIRKYMDGAPGSATSTIGSDVWWVMFRLGEIYLNASEAAFELGLPEALTHINKLRERAGFPPNSITTLTLERLQNERRVELAFEDHRLWDVIRWRIADKIWGGSQTPTTANIFALYPYRIIRPGHPNNGKFVFDKFVAPRFLTPRFFRQGNYYASISDNVINSSGNLIVRNPFH